MDDIRPCKCGCGEIVKSGNKFIHGHNARTDHPMKGKKHSAETRKKLSISHMGQVSGMLGRTHSKKTREKLSKSHTGVSLSEKHRTSIGTASKKVWASKSEEEREQWRENISKANTGRIISDVWRQRNSEAKLGKHYSRKTEFKKGCVSLMKGKNHTKETKRVISEKSKKMWENPEIRKRISESIKQLWTNPEHAQKILSRGSPNKEELKLFKILESLYPNEWKFVGDGQVIIGGKCPDFININGQKKIIEYYGWFWHQNDDPQDRIDLFTPYGYQTLVIWDKELKDTGKLKIKLDLFCK